MQVEHAAMTDVRSSEPAGRSLFSLGSQLAIVIAVGISAGFLLVVGVLVQESRSFHYDVELHHKVDKTQLLAEQLYQAVRSGDPGPVRRAYESLAAHDHLAVDGAMVTDRVGQPLTSYQQSLSDPVDFSVIEKRDGVQGPSRTIATTTVGNRFIVVAPVMPSNATEPAGSLAIAWSLTGLKASAESSALRQGGVAALAVALFAIAALAFVRRRFSQPLAEITHATKRTAKGDKEFAIPWTDRWDEIGDMARALVTFRRSLALVDHLTAEQQKLSLRLADALEKERQYSALHGEFVSMVSHEFRTPVAIIDGAAQRIDRRAGRDTPEELRQRAAKIRAAATRMIGLIESTLSVSRLEAGTIELETADCDVAALLTDVCGRQQDLSKEHAISLTIDDLPATATLDAKRTDQIFTNLLSNAVKYAPNAPRIDVEARVEGNHVVVTVRDFGLGIPREELPKLFGKYFRASTSKGIPGTGIGLNLVKHLVELHGGTISVESEQGAGSLFTVTLPIGNPPPPRLSTASEADPAAALCA